MNIKYYMPALIEVNEESFKNIYDKSSDEFINELKDDWNEDDLTNKYVISVEQKLDNPKFKQDGVYCFNILGIYTPREDQNATLGYYGHIAVVNIKDKNNNLICRLYKDDECYPQNLEEWFDYCENSGWGEGKTPTKEEFIELIKTCILAAYQNPNLELNIKEEDIIILQGL